MAYCSRCSCEQSGEEFGNLEAEAERGDGGAGEAEGQYITRGWEGGGGGSFGSKRCPLYGEYSVPEIGKH